VKKVKKVIGIPALLLCLLFSLCACGSYSADPGPAGGPADYPAADGYDKDYLYEPEYGYDGEKSAAYAPPAEGGAPEMKKIVRDARVGLNAEDVREAYGKILAFARQNGGYEFSQETAVHGEYTELDARIKIPADRLDALVAYIGDCGELINSYTNSSDITDQYNDTATRLRTKKASLEKYYELLAECYTLEDILRMQGSIDRMTEEIEVMEGKIRLWDAQVAESTVTLTIRQKDDPKKVKVTREFEWDSLTFDEMGALMLNGLGWVLNTAVSVLQWLAIVLVVTSPGWVTAGVVLLVLRRKRKNKNKQDIE